jgi:ribosomal protein S27AE
MVNIKGGNMSNYQYSVTRAKFDENMNPSAITYPILRESIDEAMEFAKRAAERDNEDLGFRMEIYGDHVVLRDPNKVGNTVYTCNRMVSPNAVRHCPKCGNRLVLSDVGDYAWTCTDCDEDFYEIEVND